MSKRFRKLSHTLYECKYHVVFCPKYRHRIFKDAVAEYTRQQIYQLLRQKEFECDYGSVPPAVQPNEALRICSNA